MLVLGLMAFFSLTWFMSSSGSSGPDPFTNGNFPYDSTESLKGSSSSASGSVDFGLGDSILKGGAIAPKLGNETAKYVRRVHTARALPLHLSNSLMSHSRRS